MSKETRHSPQSQDVKSYTYQEKWHFCFACDVEFLVDVVPQNAGVNTAEGLQGHEGDAGHHPGRHQPTPLLLYAQDEEDAENDEDQVSNHAGDIGDLHTVVQVL